MKGGFSNKIIGLQNVILWEYVCLCVYDVFSLNKDHIWKKINIWLYCTLDLTVLLL